MTEAQDCPRCGLVNPPSAQRCDCGYDFVSRSAQQSYLGSQAVADSFGSPSASELAVCVLLPFIGLLLGLSARSRGRRVAGSRMLLIAGVMLALCNAPFLLFILVGSATIPRRCCRDGPRAAGCLRRVPAARVRRVQPRTG